jgi:hypothetical protein
MRYASDGRGFTLIELLVVIACSTRARSTPRRRLPATRRFAFKSHREALDTWAMKELVGNGMSFASWGGLGTGSFAPNQALPLTVAA